VGRTTNEGDNMTRYRLEAIAALQFAQLMMRLGVKWK
jgi:hypothetical protein